MEQVESSIENAPQTTPQPDVFDDGDGTVGSETPAVPEGFGTPELDEKIDSGDFGSSEQSAVSDSSINSTGSTQSMPKSPLNRNDSKRERESHPFKRYGSGRRGSTGARASQNMRFCFECHERIDEQQCESCEKYRHWSDGTDEEPRECWYDWQSKSILDNLE